MTAELATDWKDAPEVSEESKELSMLEAIRLSTKSACGIADLALPPRAALLGDWFKEGDTGFLYAPRGLGKTWLSMLIAASIANGGQAGPWPANGAHKVVYIDGEMAVDGMLERLVGMQASENLAVLNHEILFHLGNKTLNLADHSTQSAITTYLQEVGARLVVLDNLSCLCSGMEENKGDDWERILHWLLTLRRLKIAVLIVHHAGRNGQMRGTSRREDAAFWVLKLEYTENDKSGPGAWRSSSPSSQRSAIRAASRFLLNGPLRRTRRGWCESPTNRLIRSRFFGAGWSVATTRQTLLPRLWTHRLPPFLRKHAEITVAFMEK